MRLGKEVTYPSHVEASFRYSDSLLPGASRLPMFVPAGEADNVGLRGKTRRRMVSDEGFRDAEGDIANNYSGVSKALSESR